MVKGTCSSMSGKHRRSSEQGTGCRQSRWKEDACRKNTQTEGRDGVWGEVRVCGVPLNRERERQTETRDREGRL